MFLKARSSSLFALFFLLSSLSLSPSRNKIKRLRFDQFFSFLSLSLSPKTQNALRVSVSERERERENANKRSSALKPFLRRRAVEHTTGSCVVVVVVCCYYSFEARGGKRFHSLPFFQGLGFSNFLIFCTLCTHRSSRGRRRKQARKT